MPRGFTEAERERIVSLLRREGQKLFVRHGLKRVTVSDLARIAHIAKGSFYSFYGSKEELYMDILDDCQRQLYEDLDRTLASDTRTGKQLALNAVGWLLRNMERFPILAHTDGETIEALRRKLSGDVLDNHLKTDTSNVEKLIQYGVKFSCSPVVAAKVLQQAALAGLQMDADDPDRHYVISTLVEGALEKIVRDER